MATRGKYGKVIFSEDDITFIKENFKTMTNKAIAEALGLKQTIVKTKAYQLGLKRINLEYWTEEAVQFLKDNYHKIGNRELVEIFTKRFPKTKGWATHNIDKKLIQLNLKRNQLHLFNIKERNRRRGSFGKMNVKNNPEPPKVYVIINRQTRVELKPGQTEESIKAKFNHLNPR